MHLATVLRYVKLKDNSIWNERYYIMNDYMLMAQKFGVGLSAVMTENDIEGVCSACDGLIIPGSATNINPAYYGMPPLPEKPPVDEYALDAKLIEFFLAKKKPIFGVCGGHQELNIYFGGTIRRLANPSAHGNGSLNRHTIEITEGSFVHDVFRAPDAAVNSHHNWEIGRLADDLTAVAVTHDGCIEAVENKRLKVYATQWHPEQSFHRCGTLEQAFFTDFLRKCEESR